MRGAEKAEQVKAQYPAIEVVLGDLDDSALLERESAAADIVVRKFSGFSYFTPPLSLYLSLSLSCLCLFFLQHELTTRPDTADASDHVGAAKAIAKGLVAGHTKEKPGYWLHTGGTGILTFEDSDKNEFGNHSDKVYDDWDGVDELLTLPDHAFHRNVDQLVLGAGAKHADVLRTALVCPPTIYGKQSAQHMSRPIRGWEWWFWLILQQGEDGARSPSAAARSMNWLM